MYGAGDCARLRLRIPISLAARALAKIGRCKPQACLWQIFLCEPATRKTSFPDGGYTQKKPAVAGLHLLNFCGEIGIRTLVTVTRQPALQTGALDHSAISPKRYKCRCKICSKRHVTGCEYSKIFFS